MENTAIAGLDHSIIGVEDLEAAREAYETLGFCISNRGRHVGWGTANYCIMFGPDYIELLGIVDPAQYTAGLEDFLKEGEGALKIVPRSDDIEVTREHLVEAGYEPEEIRDLGRSLEMPEGDVTPRFKLVHVPAEKTPGLSTFICQHLTPELVWRPEWMSHPNSAKAVHAYTILHDEPETLADVYERFFGFDCHGADGRLIVETGGGKLVFCRPDKLTDLHPGLVWNGRTGNGSIAVASIAVEDTDTTARVFKENGIAYARRKDGSLLVQSELACGIALCFQAL